MGGLRRRRSLQRQSIFIFEVRLVDYEFINMLTLYKQCSYLSFMLAWGQGDRLNFNKIALCYIEHDVINNMYRFGSRLENFNCV